VFDAEVAQQALAAGVADDSGTPRARASSTNWPSSLASTAMTWRPRPSSSPSTRKPTWPRPIRTMWSRYVSAMMRTQAMAMVVEVQQRGADLEQALGEDEGARQRHGEVQIRRTQSCGRSVRCSKNSWV
jgi:hypothetical protein